MVKNQEILKSNSLDGSIGFISLLIVIEKYGIEYVNNINEALKLNIFDSTFNREYNRDEINILSIIYHEITHFLDLTITLWGLEYFVRKSLFSVRKTEYAGNVFRLNYTELLMHEDLVKKYSKNTKLLTCTMNHYLDYNSKYGPFINIIFKDYFSIKVKTSINMLTLIESHAYCVESLVKIKYIESEPNKPKRLILLKELDLEIESFLNNSEYIEYNMFIVLAKKHFNYLTTKELLNFLHHLIIHVLDMDFPLIGQIVPLIKSSFEDTFLGNAISLDIQRSMSRHVIAFKLILFLYEFIENSKKTEKKDFIKKLKTNPLDFIFSYYDYLKINRHPFSSDFQFDTINELFLEKKKEQPFDYDFIIETIKYNRKNSQSIYKIKNLKDYKLADIFLNDYSCVKMPNRVDLDIYLHEESKEIKDINDYVKNLEKFHIHPKDVPTFFINHKS